MAKALGGPNDSLWRHGDFVRLWAGKTVAELGSGIGGTALPLVGVLALVATPAQMGLLTALAEAPVLLVALPAGVWVDRTRRRPLMIAADLGRAALLATVPLAWALSDLRIVQLYLVAALAGVLTVLFSLADQALLPSVVGPERLVEGNSKLGISASVAEIGGPSLGGVLVSLLGAPTTVLCQVGTFLASACCIGSVRAPEPPNTAAERRHPLHEMAEGLHLVLGHPVLRLLTASSATFTFFGTFIGTLYTLFVVRALGLSPAVLGLSIGAGGIGALLGALLTERLTRRLGLGRTLGVALLAPGVFGLLLPFIHGPAPLAAAWLIAQQTVGDVFIAVFLIGEISLRQTLIPDHLLGRANAAVQVLTRGTAPVGALLAGALGGSIGIRPTVLIGVLGIIAASGWLFLPPVRDA